MSEHTITSADQNVEITVRPAGSEPADVKARRIAERTARGLALRERCARTTTTAPHLAHEDRGCPLTPEAARARGL